MPRYYAQSRRYRRRFRPRRYRRYVRRTWPARRYSRRPRRRTTIRKRWINTTATMAYRKLYYRDTGFDMTIPAIYDSVYHAFRGNSGYDPDATGAGVQPYGWDEHAALYNEYRIVASKITINIDTTSTDRNLVLVVLPWGASTGIGGATLDKVMQQRYTKAHVIDITREGSKKITHYFSTSKAASYLYNSKSYDRDWAAAMTDNPANQWYWIVYLFTADGNTVSSNLISYMNVKIKYYTKLSSPHLLNQS